MFARCVASKDDRPPVCGVVTALPKLNRSTDMITVCCRWRLGGEREEVGDAGEITRSYKTLAVGDECNTAEEDEGRQTGAGWE